MQKLTAVYQLCYLVFLSSLIEARIQRPNIFSASVDDINNTLNDDPPEPPYTDYARMARYLVHKAEWVALGTISTLDTIKGFPMVNIISVADSAKNGKSTGTLYFFLTMLDFTAQDLSKINKLTIMISNDQDLNCSKNGTDPMEPTCARTMISGSAIKLERDDDEYQFGINAMASRHPASIHWLKAHNFFLCKMKMDQIVVLDYYGGPHYVSYDDYMNADLVEMN